MVRMITRGDIALHLEVFCLIDVLENGIAGTILFNWKITLGNPDKLTNWVDQTDPCGSNPWFNVLCNGSFVQRM
jgi:hypothetical protein